MANGTERLLSGFVALFGAGIAAVAAVALFGDPVDATHAAVVRALALVAGVAVTVGGALVALGRLPVLPVAPMASAPAAIAGSALALSVEGVSLTLHAVAGVAVACALLGFVLVAVTAGDND